MTSRRMVSLTWYFDKDSVERLRRVSQKTKVPMAEIIRIAVNRALTEIEFNGITQFLEADEP